MYKTPLNAMEFQKLPEFNSGKKLVETAGYIPAQKRIENLMLAGQRLVAHRMELYDCPAGETFDEDLPCDPTRSGDFDLADGTQMALGVNARLAEQAEKSAAKESKEVAPSSRDEGEEMEGGE